VHEVGVNIGEALVGNIGIEVLRNFYATGDAVNVAPRLQEVARSGQVVIRRRDVPRDR